jgi:hypothetical protein
VAGRTKSTRNFWKESSSIFAVFLFFLLFSFFETHLDLPLPGKTNRYGKDWKKIEKLVETKDAFQVRMKFFFFFFSFCQFLCGHCALLFCTTLCRFDAVFFFSTSSEQPLMFCLLFCLFVVNFFRFDATLSDTFSNPTKHKKAIPRHQQNKERKFRQLNNPERSTVR